MTADRPTHDPLAPDDIDRGAYACDPSSPRRLTRMPGPDPMSIIDPLRPPDERTSWPTEDSPTRGTGLRPVPLSRERPVPDDPRPRPPRAAPTSAPPDTRHPIPDPRGSERAAPASTDPDPGFRNPASPGRTDVSGNLDSPASPDPDPLTRLYETKSSVFEKVPPEHLRKVNRAIIDRDPPTYPAVYKRFDLRAHGVSFSAFFRYAHGLRLHAAACTFPPGGAADSDAYPDPFASIVTMLTNRLIEALADPEPSFNAIHRMMNTLRVAMHLRASRDRLDSDLKRHCDAVSDHSNAIMADLAKRMQATLEPNK